MFSGLITVTSSTVSSCFISRRWSWFRRVLGEAVIISYSNVPTVDAPIRRIQATQLGLGPKHHNTLGFAQNAFMAIMTTKNYLRVRQATGITKLDITQQSTTWTLALILSTYVRKRTTRLLNAQESLAETIHKLLFVRWLWTMEAEDSDVKNFSTLTFFL